MDINLDAVVGNGSLTDIVADLIVFAEAEGRMVELVNAAIRCNSGNPKLRLFAESVGLLPSKPKPTTSTNAKTGVLSTSTPPKTELNSEGQLPDGELIEQLSLHSFNFEVVKLSIHGVVERREQATAKRFIEDLGDGVSLEMVKIPSGDFSMGAPNSDNDSHDNERPQHPVHVNSFYIGRYPVTQEQYKALMGSNPSHFKGDKLPVEHVSRENAESFCWKLMEKSKRRYRLPSEAEWEYSCRAGTKTPFHFGESISEEVCNYGRCQDRTSLVGKFSANDFGLCDMHGNVWEWCQDNWYESYDGAPINGAVWHNEENHVQVLRGGSWDYISSFCRSSFRGSHYLGNLLGYNGFRVVLSDT